MGFLKEKTGYRPTSVELTLAWIITTAAGLGVAAWLWKSCAR